VTWSGEFVFGDFWAAFRGTSGDNSMHRHATIQIALSDDAQINICDHAGHHVVGSALQVKAGASHSLSPARHVMLIFVEPQSDIADFINTNAEERDISALPSRVRDLIVTDGPLIRCLDDLLIATDTGRRTVHPALQKALKHLDRIESGPVISSAARVSGLSESRLRSVAREQLGVTLSAWVAWRQMRLATQALMAGCGLAEAAQAGGFSDQAHFTRRMREMMGITPGEARNL